MAKIIDFFDGAQTVTVPTIGNIEASSLSVYGSDGAFEIANGPGEPGDVYINDVLNVIRYWNDTAGEWQSILSAGGVVDATNIADGSVSNTEFQYINSLTSNAQTQLNTNASNIATVASDLSSHIADITSAHLASAIEVIPSGNLAADDAQAALLELQEDIDTRLLASEKGAASGVAPLNGSSKIDAIYLPSYVEDVEEYANLAAFPVSGETGKIYVALDTNKTYRWTGSIYVEISPSEVNSVNGATGIVSLDTDDISEGTALYFTDERAQDSIGGILGTTSTIDLTYNDALPEISADIVDGSVSNTKLSDMATQTFKGRTTAGTGSPEDLTATQATAILNTMVGDSGSGGTKGLVPAPASGDAAANKFLKADGTWTVVATTGANDTLSNLSSPIAFNQNLTPDGNNTRNIGSSSFQWADVIARKVSSYDGSGINRGTLDAGITTSSASTSAITGALQLPHASGAAFAVQTQASASNDAVATNPLYFETGSKTHASSTGNTGLMQFRTGSSEGGNSGSIEFVTGGVNAGNSGSMNFTTGSVVGGSRGPMTFSASGLTVNTSSVNITGEFSNHIKSQFASLTVGTTSAPFGTHYAAAGFNLISSGVDRLIVDNTNAQSLPSGATVNTGIRRPYQDSDDRSLAITTASDATASAVATGSVLIETGNKTAGTGNGGDIKFRVGTSSGGSGGKIYLQNGSEGTSGHIWTSTGTNGEGTWAVNLASSPVAFLKDIQGSGTPGGTFTSGAYQTRVLNTLEDPSSIVTSLSSNQFTLPAGTYAIDASCPAYLVDFHKAKLRNVTDATDVIIGTSEYSSNFVAETAGTRSKIVGVFTIASPKTFAIQHRCSATLTTTGLGLATSFGDSEVYTVVKIEKKA